MNLIENFQTFSYMYFYSRVIEERKNVAATSGSRNTGPVNKFCFYKLCGVGKLLKLTNCPHCGMRKNVMLPKLNIFVFTIS